MGAQPCNRIRARGRARRTTRAPTSHPGSALQQVGPLTPIPLGTFLGPASHDQRAQSVRRMMLQLDFREMEECRGKRRPHRVRFPPGRKGKATENARPTVCGQDAAEQPPGSFLHQPESRTAGVRGAVFDRDSAKHPGVRHPSVARGPETPGLPGAPTQQDVRRNRGHLAPDLVEARGTHGRLAEAGREGAGLRGGPPSPGTRTAPAPRTNP